MNAENKLKVAIATLLILGMSASSAMAAATTGTAEASVEEQISISISKELRFGELLQDNFGGTVTLKPGPSNNTTFSGVKPVIGSQFGSQSALFIVSGDANRAFTTTVDPSVDLTGPDGSAPMNATLTNASDGVLDAFQNANVFIGGTLTVGGNQTIGAYTGTYNVTVDY
ncbi:MAG: DUF4402 domain-containing protein [Nitrospina sp.]|jgi:hypothetical protein|nr:DUF4402 domain-containing protein [Nitrospina sp.]MBT6717123.1 DUF4402 domain-containing protein [Nitrospina sp.]